MNRNVNFDRFIHTTKEAARTKHLRWDIEIDDDGWVVPNQVWDLDKIVGSPQAKKGRVHDLGADRNGTALLNLDRSAVDEPLIEDHKLDVEWVDLLKAVTIDWILIQKNRTSTVYDNRLRPLRILAACARDVPPWRVTVDHVRAALELSSRMGSANRVILETTISRVFDVEHLADNIPLLNLALGSQPRAQHAPYKEVDRPGGLRKRLEDRKTAEKLPEMRAFWELVRIVFTEEPKTFTDALRFDHMKILICTGFRISETCIIPADWRRERTYLDPDGRPAGELGGFSKSLSIRHFAEKQKGKNEDGQVLFEATQHVPQIFEPIVEEAFDKILTRTEPLRRRLKAQTETGRLFPEFDVSDLVPAGQFYPRLSGELRLIDDKLPHELEAAYRATFDPGILDEIWATQQRRTNRLRRYAVNYFHQFGVSVTGEHGKLFPARMADGSLWDGPIHWMDAYVRVGELEEAVRVAMPRKLPDVAPHKLNGGRLLYPHEILLVAPKHAIVEERNGSILDVNRYFSIGNIDDDDMRRSLGSKVYPISNVFLGSRGMSLFTRYGRTDQDRALSLTRVHSIRHLQNTELFRLGLADTIITKKFDRKNVTQSYVYDHRSLAEELDAMELPKKALEVLPPKAQETFKLIKSGRVKGPLVREFERIQETEGEEAALEYLSVEADGFHSTPYGYCVNSFTVDPCPKHLECFNGCRHLALSANDEHQSNLATIERQLELAVKTIEARPAGSVGRENQLMDARRKLSNVRIAAVSGPGSIPFPDGADLSFVVGKTATRTVLDGL